MTRAHTTTDHQRIRHWVESRGGHPAAVTSTGEHGLLRIDFDPPDDSLEEIDWETFFETFDRKHLAFLYQDVTVDGKPSRFNKFIDRTSTEAVDLSDDAGESETENESEGATRRARASGSKASRPSKSSTKSSSKNKVSGKKAAKQEEEDEAVEDEDWDDDEDESDEEKP